jgi:hypothetical protein
MWGIIKKHPLLSSLIGAIIIRLIAVIFSCGYMANDDHFETVNVAYRAVQIGLLNDSGLMRWNAVPSDKISRSPLYVLTLYIQMKVLKLMGISDLDSMMYFIRFIHALLSLLIIWFAYRYIYEATESREYSFLGAAILSFHFLMPYLSVRNLIEMVSADFLVPAVYLAYRGISRDDNRLLFWAGILAGLSWMIRFNTGLAVLPIPVAIWLLTRKFRPVLAFIAGGTVMVIFSGYLDYLLLGGFGRSSVNIINAIIFPAGAPPIPRPFWNYLVLILAVFIPPFSFYFLFSFFNRALIRKHLILFSAVSIFFLSHSLVTHKEERFMIPIFPLLVMMGAIGLYTLSKGKPAMIKSRFFRFSAGAAAAINLILLSIMTINYGHKGMVEPFAYLSHQTDVTGILIDRTERFKIIPYIYTGFNMPRRMQIDNPEQLGLEGRDYACFDSVNYFVIFADSNPESHVQMLAAQFPGLRQVYHIKPSILDWLLHGLNPRHNRLNESYVYKRDTE